MKALFVFLFLISIVIANAQDYPLEIKNGETLTVTAEDQSLWIITSSQMDSVIVTGEHLKICNEQNSLNLGKITKLEAIRAEQVAIIDTLKQGYEHYNGLWAECDRKLEKTEKEVVKQKRMHKWFATGGLAAGIAVMLLIGNL